MLHLKSPELIKEAISNMMDINKLKAIGEYQEPSPTIGSKPPSPIKTPGVRIRKVRERKSIDATDTDKTPERRIKIIKDPINKNKKVDMPIDEEEQQQSKYTRTKETQHQYERVTSKSGKSHRREL